MLIKEILKHLENGGSLKDLSTEGTVKLMPYKRLTKAMKAAGYESQNKGGKEGITWVYISKDNPPLEKSIFEFDNSASQRKGTVKAKRRERIKNVITTDIEEVDNVNRTDTTEIVNVKGMDVQREENVQTTQTPVFTITEIATLKEIIATWNQNNDTIDVIEAAATKTDEPLYERVRGIKQEKKMRKTLSINESVGKALDEFAKREKVYKADVIELALWDFMKKYQIN